MRVNIYAEEMTDRIEIIAKVIDGRPFTGLRFYLELPATVNGQQYRGPFMHRPGDDDSSAVTFWGKRDLRVVLRKALTELDRHYAESASLPRVPVSSAHPGRAGVESGPGQPTISEKAAWVRMVAAYTKEEYRDGLRQAADDMLAQDAEIRRLRGIVDECQEAAGIHADQAEDYCTVPALIADKVVELEDRARAERRAGIEAAADLTTRRMNAANARCALSGREPEGRKATLSEHQAYAIVAHELYDTAAAIRALADGPASDPLLAGLAHVREHLRTDGHAVRLIAWLDAEIAARGGTKGG